MLFKSSDARFLLGLVSAYFMIFAAPANAMSDLHSKPHHHKEYAKLKNPVPMSEESIRAGRTVFEKKCISCHGNDAKGGVGPDLTEDQWIHGPSDGEIFYVISDGVAGTPMKGFKDELSQDERWHIVNYIRSSNKKRIDGQ
jgi:mono/diheme cytochrome c family protein